MDGFGYFLALIGTGLVFGALGRLIVPGPNPIGILLTILVGIGGAILGGLIGRALWGDDYAPGLIMGSLSAALIVWIIDRFQARRAPL